MTYAALFIGPPISIAIIDPTINPKTTFSPPLILSIKFLNAVIINAIGAFTTNNINTPIINEPSTGNKNIGLIPSIERGIHENAYLSTIIMPPAKNPATSAPKNPEGV